MPNTRKIRALSEWNKVKGEIHSAGRIPDIHEGEVWWCIVGKNVGIEINGKGERYVFRLCRKMGTISEPDFKKIADAFWDLYK